MQNIKFYIVLVMLLAFFPGENANAAVNAYLKLDSRGGVTEATGENPSGDTGVIAPPPEEPTESGRDVYLEIGGVDGETAAGPALLEIDTIRGESPEDSSVEPSDRLKNAGPEDGWSVSIMARELRGWAADEKQAFLATVKTQAEVKSEQELENFAKGVLLKDENVKSVALSQEKMSISYEMPARFLGIFPTSLTMRAEVATDGTVKIALPWYAFLFKKLFAMGDIKSEMVASLPEVEDEVLVSFEMRASVMTILNDILKTKHDTAKNSINNIR